MNRFPHSGFRSMIFLYFLTAVFAREGAAQQSTAIALAVAPNAPALSDPVTLTATISPAAATGQVTFYDGTAILGVSGAVGGKATLVTRLLPSGTRFMQARYWGQAGFNTSASDVVRLMVIAREGFGFAQATGSPFAVAANSSPVWPVVADFNGDGTPDLAVPSNSGNGVTLLLGDGNGGFTPSPGGPFAKGIKTFGMAAADFNGDGKTDLAINDNTNNNVTIWLGDGAGGFLAPEMSYSTGVSPFGLAVGDFNADGKPDLAITNFNSDTVTVLLGDGNGGLLLSGRTFATDGAPRGITVADFNGDGKPDLAIACSASSSVTVLLGDGDGGFTSVLAYPLQGGSAPWFLAAEDFNGDGKPDLAVANTGSDGVTVLIGDGNGGFSQVPGSPFHVGSLPFAIALGDFNGDGKPDLAASSGRDNNVSVLLGHWSGDSPDSFLGFIPAPGSPFLVGNIPFVASGDFNRDGRLDFAAGNLVDNNISVLLAKSGLRITQSRARDFSVDQPGVYVLTLTNDRGQPVRGEVTVTDVLPPGLTPTAWTGTGWSCAIAGQNVTCTRSDELASGRDYPPVNLTVEVAGSACPSAPNLVKVLLDKQTAVTDSQPTAILNCLIITQNHAKPFVVNAGAAAITLTIAQASGAAIDGRVKVTVTDALPLGLIPTAAGGAGWSCAIAGQNVSCTRPGDSLCCEFPPINLAVNVGAAACPTVINVAQVLLDGEFQSLSAPDLVEASGCLVTPLSVDFPSSGAGGGQTTIVALPVISSDKNSLSFTAVIRSKAFGTFGSTTCNLNPGDFCTITLVFVPSCLGEQSDVLTIVTDIGATYQVLLKAVGVPKTFSFEGPPDALVPGQPYAVTLKPDPVPDAACAQNMTIALTFSPLVPDAPKGTNFDVSFDPATSTLQPGTVAGVITLQAQVNGKNIAAQDGSGTRTLQAPSQPGVIRSVSIDSRTASSFQVAVAGFSTPRETGDNATTQVCLTFSPASGASLPMSSQLCGLKEDIRIWYERSTSYPTGSQFRASLTVAFSGDINAFGAVKVVLKNKEGDSSPYCVDFKSGNKLDKCQ